MRTEFWLGNRNNLINLFASRNVILIRISNIIGIVVYLIYVAEAGCNATFCGRGPKIYFLHNAGNYYPAGQLSACEGRLLSIDLAICWISEVERSPRT